MVQFMPDSAHTKASSVCRLFTVDLFEADYEELQ